MKKVTVRDFQHNLAKYLRLAQAQPLLITKYGQVKVIVVNPDDYQVEKRTKSDLTDLMELEFVGLHKDRWPGKSTAKVAQDLRKKAWYGK